MLIKQRRQMHKRMLEACKNIFRVFQKNKDINCFLQVIAIK